MTPPAEYRGRLRDLVTELTLELKDAERGRWAARLLRGGALVALQLDDQGRRTLRIAREERPANDRARARWDSELDTFLRYFDAERWHRLPDPPARGIAALYVEVFRGECRPGHVRCLGCGDELMFDVFYGTAIRCKCGLERESAAG